MVELKTLLSNGNMKVGADTLIFNFTAAIDCPADELGLCPVFNKCYAKKAERQYRDVLAYRRPQEEVWDCHTASSFAKAFMVVAKSKKKTHIQYFRFSEAGDLRHQEDADKLANVAYYLSSEGITTYGYTARRDLDLTKLMGNAIVNGSGFMASNQFKAVEERTHKNPFCPGSCRGCRLCKIRHGREIEVLIH